jgi:5-methylcytosine-specific restriction endonuclease McrA
VLFDKGTGPATVCVMADTPLPEPESERLAALVGDGSLRLAYGLLYRRRSHPPTKQELAYFLRAGSVDAPVDRVLRSLGEYFSIVTLNASGDERYELQGWAGSRPVGDLVPISSRLKAQALAPGRCSLCGKTPERHGVVLEVDLRVPAEWGGTNEPENLWALCVDCHQGWQQYVQTYAPYTEQISRAANFDEPQRRIGELLIAFQGDWVSSDLIGIVASAKEYQEDFQRRIRDLRFLGWEYKQKKTHNEGARVKVYYRLVHAEPWPDNIRAAISREEKRRKELKRARARRREANGRSD